MDKQNSITAAILAGGKSLRFGSPKFEALFKGRRLLDVALGSAAEIGETVIVIGENANTKKQTMASVYADIFRNKGPLGGIHTALTHAETPVIAVLPADMPFLTAEIYRHLFRFYTNEKPLAAESDKGLEPLVSLWPVHFLAEIEQCITQGTLGIFKCWEKWKAHKVDCSAKGAGFDQRIFININRRQDLLNI